MFSPLLQCVVERFLDSINTRRQFDRFIGVLAGEIQCPLVIVDLEVGELEPVGRGYDHDVLGLVDLAGLEQFDQCSKGDACMRAVEHAGVIAERCCV